MLSICLASGRTSNVYVVTFRGICRYRLLSTVIAALKVSFMPRFVALRIEHKLDDLISFCVSAVVLAAVQILQESWRLLFEFTARFASLFEMSDKQNDFAADLCSTVPAD